MFLDHKKHVRATVTHAYENAPKYKGELNLTNLLTEKIMVATCGYKYLVLMVTSMVTSETTRDTQRIGDRMIGTFPLTTFYFFHFTTEAILEIVAFIIYFQNNPNECHANNFESMTSYFLYFFKKWCYRKA